MVSSSSSSSGSWALSSVGNRRSKAATASGLAGGGGAAAGFGTVDTNGSVACLSLDEVAAGAFAGGGGRRIAEGGGLNLNVLTGLDGEDDDADAADGSDPSCGDGATLDGDAATLEIDEVAERVRWSSFGVREAGIVGGIRTREA